MGASFPQVLVKIKRYLKPPPRKLCCFIFFKYVLIVFGWVGLNFFIQRNCHIYLENGRSKFKSNSICSEQKPWKLKSSKTQKHLEEIESLHPPKTNMEPENGWFGVDDLPFPGENTLRFQPFIFLGVIPDPSSHWWHLSAMEVRYLPSDKISNKHCQWWLQPKRGQERRSFHNPKGIDI